MDLFFQPQESTQMRCFNVNNAKADAILIWSLIPFNGRYVAAMGSYRWAFYLMLPHSVLWLVPSVWGAHYTGDKLCHVEESSCFWMALWIPHHTCSVIKSTQQWYTWDKLLNFFYWNYNSKCTVIANRIVLNGLCLNNSKYPSSLAILVSLIYVIVFSC